MLLDVRFRFVAVLLEAHRIILAPVLRSVRLTPGMRRARQHGGSMPMLDALLTTAHSSGTAPTSIPLLDQARIVSVGSQRPRVSFAKLLDCSRICQARRFNPEDGFRETQRSEQRMHRRGLMGRVDGRRIP
jgi:hypothetical protein